MDRAASLDRKPITSMDNVGGALAPTTPQLAHLRHHIEAWLAVGATPAEERPGLEHALAVINDELAERLATLVYIDDEVAFGAALEETARGVGIPRAAPARPTPSRRPAPAVVAPTALGSGVVLQPIRGGGRRHGR